MSLFQKAKSTALGIVRNGRPVAWTPEWMRLGNLLYVGEWAFQGSEEGRRVLSDDKQRESLSLFPELRDQLSITRNQVKFTDKRVMPWSGEKPSADAYTSAEIDGPYIRQMLLPNSVIVEDPVLQQSNSMVINVRRGDYFSVAANEKEFGMDQVSYVRHALRASVEANGAPDRFLIISDGLDWCRAELGPILSPYAPADYEDGDVAHDLNAIVNAPRLLISNSTFSYWGGYIGDELNPGREVIAPWFFGRSWNNGRAHQLRRNWRIIRGDFY
ncbi:alpha-1,2-fucosyltransferase [Neomicrococcus lactis]|uniref:alpha-1,2-fucosyltransferase n=1 Tax=Neomicrococcus lactis TaxID=732241 RepID=UPI002300A209|nr:alpha-1,2-fucosyltransferase [Neomicrococcus lactis]